MNNSHHWDSLLSVCPFCKTRDALGIAVMDSPVTIRCEICNISFTSQYGDTVTETVEAWNARTDPAKHLVNKQIDDESLWHWARSDLEVSLQRALRELHGVIESED